MTQEPDPYASVVDPKMRFDRCTSGRRPGHMRFLRMLGEGRAPGCTNAQPWWTNVWAFMVAAAAIAVWAATEQLGLLDTITAVATALLIWALLVMTLNPRRFHGVCDLCGMCSVQDGVDPARTRKASIANLRAAGWTTDPRTGRAHCRGHAEVPFIHTY